MKVRHHYLPRFYLRGFCNQNEKIWTYKKDDPGNPYSNAISNTAVIRHLYSLSLEGGEDGLEDYFAEEIEGPAVEALKKLRSKQFPTAIERENLSIFFSTLFTRTPVHIAHLSRQQSQQLNIYARLLASNKEEFHSSYEKLRPGLDTSALEIDRQAILRGNFPNKDLLLQSMLQAGIIYSRHLCSMRWVLLEANSNYPFITSDNPLYITHPNIQPGSFFQAGLGMQDTRVSIPISKELSLLLFNNDKVEDGSIWPYSKPGAKDLIKLLNNTTFINSYQYVFANDNSTKLKTCFTKLLKTAEEIENRLRQ